MFSVFSCTAVSATYDVLFGIVSKTIPPTVCVRACARVYVCVYVRVCVLMETKLRGLHIQDEFYTSVLHLSSLFTFNHRKLQSVAGYLTKGRSRRLSSSLCFSLVAKTQ